MRLFMILMGSCLLIGNLQGEITAEGKIPRADFPEWSVQSAVRPLSTILISNYLLESETPSAEGRANYDYVYRLEAVNQGPDYYQQVNANLLSILPEGVQLINSLVNFGMIGPVGGAEYRVLSKNTFALRKNPATPLDLTTLQWQVSGERLGMPPVKRGKVTGVVVDTHCRRVETAPVTLAATGVSTKTDPTGQFSLAFGPKDLNANHTLLLTTQPEGYTAHQVKIPLSSQTQYDLTLVVKPVTAHIAVIAPYRQEINLIAPYQAGFSLPAAGLIEEKLLVSEPVSAQLTPLDLSTTERSALPGKDFFGISSDNPLTTVALEVLAAAEVTLIGASGTRYQRLATPASLRFAIPGHLLPQVSEGEVLPLWYYDNSLGIWREEGSGVVRRDANDGRFWVETQINHLSWWMVARPLRELSCMRFRAFDEENNALLDQVRFEVEGVSFMSGAHAARRGEEWAFTTKRTKDLTNPELVRLMFYEHGIASYLQRDATHPTRYYKVGMPGLATPFPMSNVAMQHTTQWDNCQDLGIINISARIKQ